MAKKKPSPRYTYDVVEECVMNQEFAGYRGGRIEVYDRERKDGYAIYEARFMLPEDLFEGFRDAFDEKESDLPVYIKWEFLKALGL